MKYTAIQIKNHDVDCCINNKWIPCRPINFTLDSISDRITHAWGVLVGKYDALDWQDGKMK